MAGGREEEEAVGERERPRQGGINRWAEFRRFGLVLGELAMGRIEAFRPGPSFSDEPGFYFSPVLLMGQFRFRGPKML